MVGQLDQRDHPADAPMSIHDMTVAYHRKPVLWNVDYIAPRGRLIAIVGPNGAGKTTLIKAVLDLVPKVSGSVRFFGAPTASSGHASVTCRSARAWTGTSRSMPCTWWRWASIARSAGSDR